MAYPDNGIINPRNKGSANTDYNMKHYNKSEKSVTKGHRPDYSEYEHTSTQTESRVASE